MKSIIFLTAVICNLLICNLQSFSNNIQVNNATLTGQVPASDFTFVQFDLSWENSWRDIVNWDAAWVFVKFKASYDTTWKHASLNTSGHTIPSSFTGSTTTDFKGIFIHRSANGNGNVSLTGILLRWNYGTDGVNDADLVEVKVFAVEMDYIPQGNFFAGDGSATTNGQFSQGNSTAPFLITSEGALTLGGAPLTNLGNRNASGMFSPVDDFNNTITQTLPASFPKGYNDIYCMKYEISQGQYMEFLNTLTRTQQRTRVQSDISGDVVTNIYVMSNTSTIVSRNTIVCPSSGNGTTNPVNFSLNPNRPDRACNWLTWMDGCAYMDWAGLRPMTELELEKICRGPISPLADECAWGSNATSAAFTISGTENGTETITTPNVNCNWTNIAHTGGDGGPGPLRCGIFAKLSTTRQQAGATYYGVMEMSGNVEERTVCVGNSTGRLFDGLHGDGILSTQGNANTLNWPGLVSGQVTGVTGSNLRMGEFGPFAPSLVRLSDRSNASVINATRLGPSSFPNMGFRGVRTSEVGTLKPNGNNQKQ